MREFVHLHLHTEYSILDGAIRLEELFEEAQRQGMRAVAMTDHGNLFGAVKFSLLGEEFGIKPIIGAEMYIAPEGIGKKETAPGKPGLYHITLLAENEEGYKNLIKLSTISYLEGFYYKPRIDKELLRKHSQGLIALSGCLQGEIPKWVQMGMEAQADAAVEEYMEIFGRENFFLELMDHGLEEQKLVNSYLIKASEKFGLGLVATNDAHYLRKEDHELHDILLCIQTKSKLTDEGRMRFKTSEFYFKSAEEMEALFREVPQALDNTVAIAERVNFHLRKSDRYYLPQFPVPQGYPLEDYFEELVWKGFEERWEELRGSGIPREEYEKRLRREIEVIKKKGFSGYFLIVWDIVKRARERGIPVGPGRGSAAGSLVSYRLGITQLEPLKYGLLFERFLNEERVSMPDIDIDFCRRRRGEVVEEIKRTYGSGNVSQIITFGTMKARAAIRDVGRVLSIDDDVVDRTAKKIPFNMTIMEALEADPTLREEYEKDSQVKKLIDNAVKIEGRIRQASVHAAGVVISPKPLVEILPLYRAKKDITTQFEMSDLEALGLLKMDILGLANLTVIDDTLKMLREREGVEIDLKKIPLDDPETLRIFQEGKTNGVFQFESSGMKRTLMKAKPRKFEHLIALNALYRPGPMQYIDLYIRRMHGEEKVTYPFPELEPILKETYGVLVYQEQVMLVAVALAGFSMTKADDLRKAMGKKKVKLMEKLGKEFVEGAVARGKDPAKVRKLFEDMMHFGQYAFNKSHAAVYSLVAFWTAYLKTHYPTYFLSALLTNAAQLNRTSEILKYINDAKDFGIEVLPPDVNESESEFVPVGKKKIRFGLSAIKNVGVNAIKNIIETRKRVGKFKSIFHFIRNVNTRVVTQRVMKYLIMAGAMDCFGMGRNQMVFLVEKYLDRIKKEVGGLFDQEDEEIMDRVLKVEEWDQQLLLSHEKEALGFYLSRHPLDPYLELLKKIPHSDLSTLAEEEEERLQTRHRVVGVISEKKINKTRTKKKMAWLTIEDLTGVMRALVYPDTLARYEGLLAENIPLVFHVVLKIEPEGDRILILEKVVRLEDELLASAKEIVLKLRSWDIDEERLESIMNLLYNYRGGSTRLILSLETSRGVRKFESELIPTLNVNTALVRLLKKRLGEDALHLVY